MINSKYPGLISTAGGVFNGGIDNAVVPADFMRLAWTAQDNTTTYNTLPLIFWNFFGQS